MVAGESVSYDVKITNGGPDILSGDVIVNIQPPSSIINISYSSLQGTYNDTTNVFTLNDPLNIAEQAIITVSGTLSASFQGNSISSFAAISAPEGTLDPNLENNQVTTSFTVTRSADLELTVESNNLEPQTGTAVILTYTVTNHGPSTANNVEAACLMPSGLSFNESNVGTSYDDVTGVWTAGSLDVNESRLMTIAATVLASGDYVVTSSVTATEPDPGVFPNTDSVTLVPGGEPVASADLGVTLAVDNPTPEIGSNITITFSFINNGPNTATNVQAAGNKPTGLEYVDHNPGGYNSGFDKWFLGNMASGASFDRTVTFKVLASGTYNYNTIMTAAETDSVSSNDTDAVTIEPVPAAFKFGINTHITSQDIYRRNSYTDFDWISNFHASIPGVNMNRFDLTIQQDGTIDNTGSSVWSWYRIFATEEAPPESPIQNKYNWGMYWKQQANGVQLMPMCYDRMNSENLWDKTLQECYDSAYSMMFGFATNYGQYFPYMEFGNEWELFKKTRLKFNFGTPEEPVYRTGTHESHWIVENVDRAISYIKGMRDGVKAVNPNIQTVFNCAGWAPIYWMYRVINEANIDKVSWHWYSEMIDSMANGNYPSSPYLPQPGSSYTTLADMSDDLFPGKPIWITEFGYRWAASLGHDAAGNAENEQRQVDNFIQFMTQMRNDPRIECMMYHETLDMARINPDSDEARYGMIAAYDYANTGYQNWTYKQLATELLNGTITI